MGSSITGLQRLNNRTKVFNFLVSAIFLFCRAERDNKDVDQVKCVFVVFCFPTEGFLIDGVAINLTKYCAIVKNR